MPERIGLSESQYAARVGVTRQAIAKARKAGRLVLHADGSVDAAASDRRRTATGNPAQARAPHLDPAPHEDLKPVPQAAVGAVTETLREQGVAAEGGVSFASARTANEVMKAQERRIRLQQLKGDLVDRSRATALVFRLARQERDAWLGWPARVSALMAAEVGISAHAMQMILERHVRAHLEQLTAINPEFH
jgi:hypothetical protein